MRAIYLALGAALALQSTMTGDGLAQEGKALKAGVIGLDTSHAPAFAKLLNENEAEADLAGVKIIAAFPGGSPDIPSSADRVEGYTSEFRKMGIGIAPSIEAMLEQVDVVFLESVDGRPHMEQVIPVLKAGKPVFVDKPVAGSLADAIVIYELAKTHKVPIFSSSSLRFSSGIIGMRENDSVGKVLGCEARGPCSLEPHHPDLFWYGIHGVETLFTIMGKGCQSVSRAQTDGTELVVGVWDDGRIGTFRGLRAGAHGYGATVYGDKGIAQSGTYEGYRPLLVEIVKFFKSGQPPMPPEETLEIYAFMEAADESKRQGGCPVSIESVMAKARSEAEQKLAEIEGK
jgi:predicted dehydrogenase